MFDQIHVVQEAREFEESETLLKELALHKSWSIKTRFQIVSTTDSQLQNVRSNSRCTKSPWI